MNEIYKLTKLTNDFYKKIAESKCQYCNDNDNIVDEAFCCDNCADMAFADDAKSFLNGDINDAKCVGTKSSPVGSPRQRAFCGRMCGHKKINTGAKTKSDPDSCINQSLRKWKCRCS